MVRALFKRLLQRASAGHCPPDERRASVTSPATEGNPPAVAACLQSAEQALTSGNDREAEGFFEAALRSDPQCHEALTRLGFLLLKRRDSAAGLLMMARAVQAMPCNAAAHNNLGVALGQAGDYGDALRAFARALELAPGHVQYLKNAGLAAVEGRFFDQLEVFLDALPEDEQDKVDSLFLRGALHQGRDDWPAAEAAYRRAYGLCRAGTPDLGVFISLGYVIFRQGRRQAAMDVWAEALALFPAQPLPRHNLATLLAEFGQKEEARRLVEQALQIDPDFHQTRLAYAGMLLAEGDYAQGWPMFESRLRMPPLANDFAHFDPVDRWTGQPLAGRSLLLFGEQGLGDQLQFVRYLALLHALAPGELILCCHPSLIPLFSAVDRATLFVSLHDPLPPFDYFCPLMSLPLIFNTQLATIPAQPYLRAEPQRQADWARRLAATPGRRVGLVWGGNPRRQDKESERTDARRSITLAHYAPLWDIPGISFFSLQKGEPAAQIKDWPMAERPLLDYTDELDDFADTAALLMNLDLVISVDTSVVHLAGGLGKPVWVLSRLDGCWRWLEGRADSPWYPSARIFRQAEYGDWSSVIGSVSSALATWRGAPVDDNSLHNNDP